MTNTTSGAPVRNTGERRSAVADTGAHGPPKPERERRLRRCLAAGFLALMTLGAVTATAPSAAAVPSAAAQVLHSVAPTTNGSVSHSGKGTAVYFYNESGASFKVGDHTVGAGGNYHVSGRSGDGDDISTTITGPHGPAVKFYGHNPRMSEAYLQFDGQKVFDTSKVQVGGMALEARFSFDSGGNKVWAVTMLQHARYTHEFIHHTDENDGVKGTVTNRATSEAVVRLGSADLKLAPGQSLLFFDAHHYEHGNRGTQMHISGSGHPGYEVKAIDPDLGKPWLNVTGCGEKNWSEFSEGQSRSYVWDPNWQSEPKLQLHVTRDHDGRMDVAQENWHTKDWARFTITITNT